LKQSVIDDAIDQWHTRLRDYIQATRGHFDYYSTLFAHNMQHQNIMNEDKHI